MILLTFARFIKNSTVFKLCRNCLIKTEPIENSKSDRRLAEKELQITGKLAQLVGKGGRPASDERRDAANVMPNAGTEGQNAIWRGRNTEIRDKLPIYSAVPGRTTANRDELSFCTFSRKRYPKLLAAKFLCKLLQLLSLCYPKFWRPVIRCRKGFPSRPCHEGFGKLRWYVTCVRRNARKFRRNAFAKWRDATKGMPNAVNGERNTGTEGRNTIWRGQNASLCFSLSTTLFCAFQYLLGRTAIFRDKLPICSTVLGRTTASWDQRRFWNIASNDRQPAEKAPQITKKLPQLVGTWLQSAFVEKRDAANAMLNAINRGRNAFNGERNAKKIWRNAKKFRRDAIAQWRDATNAMPKAVNRGRNAGTEGQNAIWRGRTAIFRDQLPICSTVLGLTTINRNKRRFWTSASNDKRLAEKEPQNARKLPQLVGKWVRPAFDERRDAANAMPKAVNRGRNAGTEGRNTIWRGRNAFNGERNAKKIWRNAKKFRRNASALTRGAIPSRDRFFGLLCKWALRTLKPYTIYLTTLSVLFCVCLAHARQSSSPEAAHGVALSTDSIKPLKIGDRIPEALWNLPLQMVKAREDGSTTVKLSDYKDKLIILDFWATWCAPCVAAFPKMDSLKKTFADNLALISVTSQEKKMVTDFLGEMLEQTSLKGTSIVNDRILSSYFPYRLLPHYVWIDRGGILRAMTGLDVLNAHQIDKLLSSNKAPTYVKEDVGRSYDYDIELKDQVSQQALLKNSTFAAYTKGFSRRNSIDKKNAKITLLNMSIAWFYRIAFSEFRPELLNPNRFIIEVKDSLKVTSGGAKGEALEKWSVDNAYCYELKMQPADTAKLFEQMRADIAAFFPYDAKIEQREMACLVLGKKSDSVSLETKGGQPILKHDAYSFRIQNLLWKNFTSLLDMYYLQNAGMPFVDETGITGKVDLQIKTRMTDYRELTKVLAKHGLLLKKEIRRVPVIVLRDREGGSHE
jgi:thiol-disulfide isomerase/thioredoxin